MPDENVWPRVGQTILVRDLPTTDAQKKLWRNRQPRPRKGEVIETPLDGGDYLTIDVGGEYGGITYSARDFLVLYTWKYPPLPVPLVGMPYELRQGAAKKRLQRHAAALESLHESLTDVLEMDPSLAPDIKEVEGALSLIERRLKELGAEEQ